MLKARTHKLESPDSDTVRGTPETKALILRVNRRNERWGELHDQTYR